MFDEVPVYEHCYHHGDGGGKIVADAGVFLENVDVHAEERAESVRGRKMNIIQLLGKN